MMKHLQAQIKWLPKKTQMLVYVPMIMDYIKAKRPEMLSKIDTGDMKQEVEDEAITFEDINLCSIACRQRRQDCVRCTKQRRRAR